MSDSKDSWLNRNFATLATFLISLATLVFSFVQWHVAQLNSQVAAHERERQTEADRLRRDEEWSFRALDFMFRNEKHFFGNDPQDFQRAVRMLAVGFPERISEPILKRLESQATPAQKLELDTVRAQLKGQPPPPRPAPPVTQAPPPRPARSAMAAERPHPVREALPERPRPLQEPAAVERPQPIRDRLPDRPRRRDR